MKSTKTNKVTKKAIYAARGIVYQSGKILSPANEWITEILQPGNKKTGKEVLTFSLLPTNKMFDTKYGIMPGTCKCTCKNCYACSGFYCMPTTKNKLIENTYLAYKYTNFLKSAIIAQLEYIELTQPGKKQEIRISAAGDLFSVYYVDMLKEIIEFFPEFIFWSYTKYEQFENAFDNYKNANIVKSVLPNNAGFNYGTVKEVFEKYLTLIEAGYKPYICRCGIDTPENVQHCHGCAGCALNEFVLFFLHSCKTYNIKSDPLFNEAQRVVNMQDSATVEEIAAIIKKVLAR